MRQFALAVVFWALSTSGITAEAPAIVNVEQLEAELERLLSERGPMDASLREILQTLAADRSSREDYQAAAALWLQLFEIERVNAGLYDTAQLPALYALVDALILAGEWEQADDYHHLAFHISARNWPPHSEEYIAALHRLTSWRLQAWQQELLSAGPLNVVQEPQMLRELRELYEQSLGSRYDSRNADTVDVERLELLYGKALIELETIHHLIRVPIWLREPQQPRYIRQEVCSTVRLPGGGSQRVCSMQQVPNPEYRAGPREEERIRIDRANQRLAQTLTEMASLKLQVPSSDQFPVPEGWQENYQQRLAALQEAAEEALRESRLAALRHW